MTNSTENKNNRPTHRLVRVDNHDYKKDENGYALKEYTELAALWPTKNGKGFTGKIGALNANILILPNNNDEAGA